MRKGWRIEKVKELCLGRSITRWYLQAPSGNKYYMYRGMHFSSRVYVPNTYEYFMDTKSWFDKVTMILSSGKRNQRNNPVNDSYKLALKYIYSIEKSGGFADQDKINAYLESNEEFQELMRA